MVESACKRGKKACEDRPIQREEKSRVAFTSSSFACLAPRLKTSITSLSRRCLTSCKHRWMQCKLKVNSSGWKNRYLASLAQGVASSFAHSCADNAIRTHVHGLNPPLARHPVGSDARASSREGSRRT
eukprot:3853103-Pleurochrysis_carterae.AAC.1